MIYTNDDQVEQNVYSANQHAEQVTQATTDSVGSCNSLGAGVTNFFNNPHYIELVDKNKLNDDKSNLESLDTIYRNMDTIGDLCQAFEDDIKSGNSTQLRLNNSILDEDITNFKNSKKIKSILTFLDNNSSISSIVFFYNKNPNNEEYHFKPHIIGKLPYNYDGILNSNADNYDTYYVNKTNIVKRIVHSIYDMLDQQTEDNNFVHKVYDMSLNSLLDNLYNDGELPPSSVKYNIIAKNEFIKSIKLSANSFTSEMTINTDKGNVIKLGKLTDEIPYTEYYVEDGNKTLSEWFKKYFNRLYSDPKGVFKWRPASITNSEEHRKASEAMDKFINDRGSYKTVLVGAVRSKKGKYGYCKPDQAGYCFKWIDMSRWTDNVWYQDNPRNKEPNDSGRGRRGGGESAVHMWDARENNTNLRTLNDINTNTRGAMLMKRTKLNNTETFESPDIGKTQQIVDINITAININNIKNLKNSDFNITEKKTEIEEEKDSKFRDPLINTSTMVSDLEKTINDICYKSSEVDGGKISMGKQAEVMDSAISDLEENTSKRIEAVTELKELEGFSNMYVDSNNFKMSLFCLIIYAIIIFLIFKKINNSYLKNILILITIILFIIIINSNNSNNSNNIENFTSNLNKNILLDSINNIALKVKDSYSYY